MVTTGKYVWNRSHFLINGPSCQRAAADFPFYAENKGQCILAGRTDTEGKTPRISTGLRKESLSVFWGDTALAKGEC
jgi:hypothetical protein